MPLTSVVPTPSFASQDQSTATAVSLESLVKVQSRERRHNAVLPYDGQSISRRVDGTSVRY